MVANILFFISPLLSSPPPAPRSLLSLLNLINYYIKYNMNLTILGAFSLLLGSDFHVSRRQFSVEFGDQERVFHFF